MTAYDYFAYAKEGPEIPFSQWREEVKQYGEALCEMAERQLGYVVTGGGDAGRRAYVLSALERIREKREQQTLTVLDRAVSYIREKFTEE